MRHRDQRLPSPRSPVLITDPNKNRSAVERDEMGMVVKTASMGGVVPGQRLAGRPDDADANPSCSSRCATASPYSHTLAHEERVAQLPLAGTALQNGSSGVAMVKVQAPPVKR